MHVVLGHLVSRWYLLEEDHENVADVVRQDFYFFGVEQPVQQLVDPRSELALLDLRVVVEQVRLDAHGALDHGVRVLGDSHDVCDNFERLEHQVDDFGRVAARFSEGQDEHFEQRCEEVHSAFFFGVAEHVPRDKLLTGKFSDGEGHVGDEDRQEDCTRVSIFHDLYEDVEDALDGWSLPLR